MTMPLLTALKTLVEVHLQETDGPEKYKLMIGAHPSGYIVEDYCLAWASVYEFITTAKELRQAPAAVPVVDQTKKN